MKKLLLASFFMVGLMAAYAQDYKPVKVGVGLGYASPQGSGSKGGVLFYLDPAYRVSDQLAVGLRMEAALVARGYSISGTSNSANVSGKIAAVGSYSLNAQYYFSNEAFRPFAGLGVGLFTLAAETVDVSSGVGGSNVSGSISAAASKFGFYPRVGFDLGHFTMQLEYNIIPSTKTDVTVGANTETSTTKNGYLGVKAGFFFGGGKK